jgi:hypothetical protein
MFFYFTFPRVAAVLRSLTLGFHVTPLQGWEGGRSNIQRSTFNIQHSTFNIEHRTSNAERDWSAEESGISDWRFQISERRRRGRGRRSRVYGEGRSFFKWWDPPSPRLRRGRRGKRHAGRGCSPGRGRLAGRRRSQVTTQSPRRPRSIPRRRRRARLNLRAARGQW